MKKYLIMGAVPAVVLLTLCAPALARTQTVRPDCVGDRCVWYGAGGKRLGTTTQDGTGRVIVRDSRNRRTATVERTPLGVRVERARSRN